MKYSKLLIIIGILLVILLMCGNWGPESVVIADIILLGICGIILTIKALIDTIKYFSVDKENKKSIEYKLYMQVPRKDATPDEALYLVKSGFFVYKLPQIMMSEILHLNRKGVISFENNEFDPLNPIIAKLSTIDEETYSNLTNVEKITYKTLKEIFTFDSNVVTFEKNVLTLKELIKSIQRFGVKDILRKNYHYGNHVRHMAHKDWIDKKVVDEEKNSSNFNVLVRIGIFMVVLAIPLIAIIPLIISETLDKLLTLPFCWWYLLMFVGVFGLISSIFGFFKKDDYTVEGREERAKWRALKNYLNSQEIFDDIKLNKDLITEILPYLFVLDAPKKLINFVLDNMDDSTIDMKAIKELYKLVM